MNTDIIAHALTAKLLLSIADDAPEEVIKLALAEWPRIIAEAMEALKK